MMSRRHRLNEEEEQQQPFRRVVFVCLLFIEQWDKRNACLYLLCCRGSLVCLRDVSHRRSRHVRRCGLRCDVGPCRTSCCSCFVQSSKSPRWHHLCSMVCTWFDRSRSLVIIASRSIRGPWRTTIIIYVRKKKRKELTEYYYQQGFFSMLYSSNGQ